MIYFKLCPRCRGDIKLEKSQYGEFLSCLQCGYSIAGQVRPGGDQFSSVRLDNDIPLNRGGMMPRVRGMV